MGYFFPITLLVLLTQFGDIGERGMILVLLFAVIVLAYLVGFGIRHFCYKKAPPFNKIVIVCWLITTFFFAQALPSL